mgnify:CR=1 FL=1
MNNLNMIEVNDLIVRFGKFTAVNGLNLCVEKGRAVALLGENGAGKTTTLRVIASIIGATRGSGTVLGKPIGELGQQEYARLGYVSENQKMHNTWTLKRHIDYLKPMYPTWDDAFCEELIINFDLPLDRKVGAFSRGMQMKAMLVCSLAYRPELLILDEPFSGLDPLVREELIDGIIELMQGGEWTILLSSHDINEVERLCDSVAIIENGKVSVSEPLDSLQERYRSVDITVEQPINVEPLPTWLNLNTDNSSRWSFTVSNFTADSESQLRELFGNDAVIESESLSLRDIYLVIAREKKRKRTAIKKSLTKTSS